ncbi:DNA polymerase zeta catalytic subunit-like [Mizuhopecten yessoensis]|uniref:DNA polymerase zeta catalytic subunit n=1 Tax=Mizuhopecten yessoensis TaxID=6573 RepID=A0A210PW94_MIZYE|nr:DNA polymerase zeta catalytic subunit-like [Mizuhopecten yessoensis]XP_021373618.1 DNA polymerase zeta catalytic subunit-like [Mizuhopecten yessoensis]OWF40745.1 DNA polymerase zeta catalytic subunit [Mizuhopecten yessoensis]
MFSMRIVTTDHYQATPISELDVLHSDFRGSDVYKVPVIRVYGATPAGQKTCMHVHGVFPYLYVPYDGTQPWDRYMRLFASSVDKAVNVAQGHPTSNIQHVYKITLVSGIPMYGYHDKEQQFLKIYLYNPGIVRKVADLLLGGAVMNQVYQPHESHIPYTLQMFIDYNLYGMNLINAAAVKFRRRRREDDNGNIMEIGSQGSVGRGTGTPKFLPLSLDDNQHNAIWDDTTISSDLYVDVERLSTCELEVDVVAADILNRLEVDANVGTNPGLAALWEDEKQRRRDRGETSQLAPPESQEHENVEVTESDLELRQRFHEIVLEHQPYMDSQSDTNSEASQGDDISPTPAHEVDLHMSQTEGDLSSSQDAVVLEEEEKVAPVISLESIKRVVSFSQSFSESPAECLPMSQPQRSSQGLAEMLASLAEESSPACSQVAACQLEALEEEDSVLHNTSQQPENDPDGMSEDAETLEMSQRMWGQEDEEEPVQGPSGIGERDFNWSGMDDTWNDSQLHETNNEEDDDEIDEIIPQFDGAADEKPAKSKAKKMQEVSGPVMPTFNQMGQQGQGHQPYQQNQGQYQNQSQQMMFEDNSQFMYGNPGNSSMQYNQGYQQQQGYGCNYGMDNSYGNHGAENYDSSRWGQNFQQLQEMSPPQNNMSMSWGQGNQGWGGDNSMSSPSPAQHIPRVEHQSTTDTVLSPLETVNSPVLHSPHSSLQSPLSTRQSPTLQSPSASMPSPQSLATMQPLQPLQSPTATSTNTSLDTSDSRGSQLTPMQPAPMCMGDYSSADNHGYNNYNQTFYGNQSSGDFNTGTYMNQYNQVTDQQGGGQIPQQNYSHGGYQYNQYHGNHQQLQSHPNQQQWPQQFHGNQAPMQGQSHGRKKQGNQNAGGKWTNANKSTAKRGRKTKKTQPLLGTPQVSSVSLKTVPGQVSTNKVRAQPSDEQTTKPQSTLERLLLGDEDEDCLSLTEPGQRSVSRCSNISTASSRTSVGPTTPNVGPLTSPLSPYDVKGQPQKVADLLTQVKPSSQDLHRRSSLGENTLDSSQLSNSSLLGSQEDLFMDTSSKSQSSVLSSPVQDMAIANSFSKPSSQTSQSPKLNNQSNFQGSAVTAGSQQQGKKSDTFSCLQSLQSLVSSVNKDPRFGVNVHQEGQLGNYQSPGQGQPSQSHQAHGQLSQGHQSQVHPVQGHQPQSNPSQGHQSQSHVSQGQPIHKGHPQTQQGHQSHQSHSGHPDLHGNIGFQQFSPQYKQMWSDSQSSMNTYHQQPHNSGHQQFNPYWNRQDRIQMSQGNYSPVSNTSNPPYGMKEYSTSTHGSMKFPGSMRHPTSAQSVGTQSPAGRLSPKLVRSLSVIKKRGRPRKYDTPSNVPNSTFPLTPQSPTPTQPRSRSNSVVDKIPIVKSAASNASYTFSFQVPTPVFKRLKFHKKRPLDSSNTVKFVRMHPMDARRYSLLKIGREIVKTQNLSTLDIEKAIKRIRAQNIASCTKTQAAYSDTGEQPVSDNQKNAPTDMSYMHHPGNTLAQDLFGVVPEPRMSDNSGPNAPCQQPIPKILSSTETTTDFTKKCDTGENHVEENHAGASPQNQSLKAKLSENISNLHLKKMLHERMAIKDGNRPCTYTGSPNFSDEYRGRPQPTHHTISREGQESRGNMSNQPRPEPVQGHNSRSPPSSTIKMCQCDMGKCMCPKEQDDIAQNDQKMDENDMKNGMEESLPAQGLKGGSQTPQKSFFSQFQNFLSKGYSSSDSDTGKSQCKETIASKERLPKQENGDQQNKTWDDPQNSQNSDFTANHKNEKGFHSTQNNGCPGNNGEHVTGDNAADFKSSDFNSGGHRSGGQVTKGYVHEGHISTSERPGGNTFRNHMPESQMYGNQRADGHITERTMMGGHGHPGQMPVDHMQGQMSSQMPGGHMSRGNFQEGYMMRGHAPGSVPRVHVPGSVPRGYVPGSVPRGHVPGSVPRGHVPGTIPRGHVPGTIPRGHVPGNNPPRGYMPNSRMPGSNISWDHMPGRVITSQMPVDDLLRGNEVNGNKRDESGNSIPKSVHNLPPIAANSTEMEKIEKQNTGNFLGLSDQGGCPSGHKTQLPEKKDFHRAGHPSVTPRTGVREYSHSRNIFEKLLNSKILSDDTEPFVNNVQQEQQRDELQDMNINDHVTKFTHSKFHPQKNDHGNESPTKVPSYGGKHSANFSNIIEQVLMTSALKDKLDDKHDRKMFQRDRVDGGCLVSAAVGVHANEGLQDIRLNDKNLKVIRRRNLSTKRRFKITANGHIHNVSPVIDPDGEEIQNVILKDVNLTEASNGVLTPITSQTPVAGRSPIRHNCNGLGLENYKLFDSDIICSRNELEAKLRTLKSELELQPCQSVKNYCLAENDLTRQGRMESPISASWSGLSSRTTSRKDSSESSMSAPDISKTQLKPRKRKLSCLARDGKQSHRLSCQGTKATSTENSGSDMDYTFEKENKELKRTKRKKKKKEVAGIDYIVIGRFKGHRKMAVCLERLEIGQDESVNVNDFLVTQQKCLNHSINNRTSDLASGKEQDLYINQSSRCHHSRKCSSDSSEESSYQSSCQSSPEKNPSLRAETCDDWSNDSKEQQADIDSDDPKSSKSNRKKKKLTRNQKLQIAFLSKKSRRKKTPSGGKLMNSLSLLHEATIANLNDTRLSYNENTEDIKVRYEDAMFRMSFLSSSDSDKGNISPPLPLSPEELARDHQGLTRSTSEAQSPVLPASDNSLSPIYSTMQTTLRMKNSSGSDLSPVYQPLMNQVTMCDADFKPFSSVSLRSPSSQTPAFGLGQDDRVATSFIDFNSGNSKDCDESQNSNSSENCSKKNKLKEAVIRLTPLSAADIENFCGKSNEANPSNLERVSSSVYEKQSSGSSSEGSNSPPDLGPPNIPKYPKTGPTNDNSRSPPLLLSTSSPNTSQILRTPQNHIGFGLYEHKSPVSSCSNGSLNVVHSDRFSDISDDEEDLHLQLEVNDEDNQITSNSEEETATSSPWIPDSSKVNGGGVPCMSESGSDRDMPSLVKEMISIETVDNCVCVDSLVRKCVGQDDAYPSKYSAGPLKDSNSSQSLGTSFKNLENRNLDNNTKQSYPSEENERNFNEGRCCKVLTPDILPPSRKMVQNTATSHGLNSTEIVGAYCSNPEDLPERPRELGGRVLEVQSTRVKDFDEFCNYTECEGLLTWRNRMMAHDQIILSQSENETLMNRIEKDPQLRYALLGDRSVIISPCNLPPSTDSVKKWICGRKVWKDLKNKEKQFKIDINKKTDEKRHYERHVENSENRSFGYQSSLGKTLTKEDDKINQTDIIDTCGQHSKPLSETIDQNDTTNEDTKDSRQQDIPRALFMDGDSHGSDDDEEDDDEVIGPSPPSGLRLSQFSRSRITSSQSKNSPVLSHSTPLTETEVLKDDLGHTPVTPASVVVHSPLMPGIMSGVYNDNLTNTPVHGRRISHLFNSASTPVTSGSKPCATSTPSENGKLQAVSADKTPGIFATPKRVPLPRRISSNTQKSLQQALQSSQLQQFATPTDQKGHTSQIDGPTPQNSFGFKVSQDNLKGAKALHEVQNLTVLSLELHAETRGDLRPDPDVDAVKAVFYSISNDVDPAKGKTQVTGIIIVDHVSADAERALKDRRNGRINSRSPSPSPIPSGSNSARSRSPQSCSSRSPKASTSRSRSPLPSTSKSPQPSTSKHRSPSPKPSTPRGRRTTAKGSVTPPPRDYDSTENIPNTFLQRSGIDLCDLQVTYVRDEEELYTVFLEDLIAKWDPDILVGYEIQNFSWGYLLQRASHLSIPLCSKLSRIPGQKTGSHFSATKDEYGADHMSEIHVVGRIVLNLWRLLRHEVTLNIYSYENVCFHVLHQRVPRFSFRTLSNWFNHRTHLYRWRLIEYYITRVRGNLQLIDQLDLIGRTSEFARVFGIEFYHVLSRGSQYRVESMMLRLAKPLNYISVSPSAHQRARMRAPECIALTLEPESRFYADPVVVVDFQSLYPSIMIAHNYCYSTCLGRLNWLEKAHEGPIEFGCSHLKVPPSVLKRLENDITVSPNGVAFVKQHIRKGVISAMVEEILNTRLMVKKAMKAYKDDKALYRLLDARQMGLKLIANVTYGYTGANFSGRMPCIEVADSIVRKARETLERAIKLVEDTPRWGARVVYGDTDSMFIELKGRSKEEAFKIGYEICDAVTAANPKPMKLKFEKVYLPCILQTKKRYVGFSYETPDQKEPIFDAKGIETVRRDACPAVAKILERTIKMLFTTRDVSQVKKYVQMQCRKLMEGKVSLQDLVFAKEYRGMAGYKPGACVPALEISKKYLQQDRRGEPRVGERVPYVIVYGSPGLPLIQLVRAPVDLLTDPSLRLNATYYITKQILPPLNRIFSLMGVNVFSWYNEMPKVTRIVPQAAMAPDSKKGTISQFFSVVSCPVCEEQTNQDICNKCASNPQKVAITLNNRIREWDQVYADLSKICNSCMSVQDNSQPCISFDCPILFRRRTAQVDITRGEQLRCVAIKVLDF